MVAILDKYSPDVAGIAESGEVLFRVGEFAATPYPIVSGTPLARPQSRRAGRSYTVIFKPVRISPLFPVVNGFCPGRAFVEFASVSITHPSKKTSRQLGPTVTFRVLRAR